MPLTTLRSYLCSPNPELKFHVDDIRELSTAETQTREPIEGKDAWTDFDLDNINAVFGSVLDHRFDLPDAPPVYPAQLCVRDEACFDALLIGYNSVIVNAALHAAANYFGIPKVTWLVGSYAQQVVDRQVFYPDWAGIITTDATQNIVPGDSKFAARPFIISDDQRPIESDDDMSDHNGSNSTGEEVSMDVSPHRSRWARVSDACIEQANHYATCHSTRYCYLVSPVEIVACRRTMDEAMLSSESLASTRPRRNMLPGIKIQHLPGGDNLSPSPLLSSSPPYTDYGRPDNNMRPIQLAAVRWENHGTANITFNLAVWALHMLAAIDRGVRTSYPPIASDPAYQLSRCE